LTLTNIYKKLMVNGPSVYFPGHRCQIGESEITAPFA
jgi:hypothetical protein